MNHHLFSRINSPLPSLQRPSRRIPRGRWGRGRRAGPSRSHHWRQVARHLPGRPSPEDQGATFGDRHCHRDLWVLRLSRGPDRSAMPPSSPAAGTAECDRGGPSHMFGIWENKRKEPKVWELGRTRNCNQKLCNGQKKKNPTPKPASYNPPQKCEGDNKIHMHGRRPTAKAPPRTKGRVRPNVPISGRCEGHEAGGDGTRPVAPRGRAVAGRRRSRGSAAPCAPHRLWVPAATDRNAAGNLDKLRWWHRDAAGRGEGATEGPLPAGQRRWNRHAGSRSSCPLRHGHGHGRGPAQPGDTGRATLALRGPTGDTHPRLPHGTERRAQRCPPQERPQHCHATRRLAQRGAPPATA